MSAAWPLSIIHEDRSLYSTSPEKKEKSWRILKASITDFLFLKKKLLSSAYAVYKTFWLWISKLLILLFVLIKTKETSKIIMKRNAEIGSPWRALLSRLKNFVVMPPFTTQNSWFLIRIWIHFRKRSPKPYFCKTANKKEWSTESKAFSISTVTRNPFLFKILAVSSASYNSHPLSLIYLFFTYAVWLDEIISDMSFNRLAFEMLLK